MRKIFLSRGGAGSARGISLVEVTLAIGVVSFAMIVVFGLLPVGLNSSQNSIEQTAANDVLAAVATDLRATPPTSPPGGASASARFGIAIPANPVTSSPSPAVLYFDGDGTFSTTQTTTSRYRLEVTFLPNARERAATRALLKVTWPAPASPANAAGAVSMFAAFDRN